ncbi:MAG: OmpH family outer membrane protein [Bacteroidetes bacterium]|nr:OmpH family outer membrane protein [Bacteroidota bacterium]
MKKSLLGLVLMFLVCMCFANNGVAAQKVAGSGNNNVAVVDVEAIVKELPEAIEADKQLKEIGQKYQDSLVKMQQALETKVQNYQKQKSMMQVAQQQQEEEKLQKENQTLNSFYQEKFGNTGELAVLREKLLEPIRAKVKKAIEEVAKSENVSLVLSKDASMVLYADNKLDITFRVIDKIKRDK